MSFLAPMAGLWECRESTHSLPHYRLWQEKRWVSPVVLSGGHLLRFDYVYRLSSTLSRQMLCVFFLFKMTSARLNVSSRSIASRNGSRKRKAFLLPNNGAFLYLPNPWFLIYYWIWNYGSLLKNTRNLILTADTDSSLVESKCMFCNGVVCGLTLD